MKEEFQQDIRQFVADLATAMGLSVDVTVEPLEDGSLRIDIKGDDGDWLVKRKGEALDALQHLVNSAFRRESDHQRIVVDSLGFRRGKDLELQQMARFLVERVRTTGAPQELGPLNSYARRVVHMEVAQHPDVSSESQGDGLVKRIIISPRPAK